MRVVMVHARRGGRYRPRPFHRKGGAWTRIKQLVGTAKDKIMGVTKKIDQNPVTAHVAKTVNQAVEHEKNRLLGQARKQLVRKVGQKNASAIEQMLESGVNAATGAVNGPKRTTAAQTTLDPVTRVKRRKTSVAGGGKRRKRRRGNNSIFY